MLKKMEFHLRLLMFCSVRGASTAGAGAPSQPIFKVPDKHKTSSYIRNLEESPPHKSSNTKHMLVIFKGLG
jgi:hypothetical protein